MADFRRNGWPDCVGISGRLGSDYNALFAGSDEGAENWACLASLIEFAKLNGVNPQAWLTDTLTKLVNRWPQSRIDELMPCTRAKSPTVNV